MKTTKRPAAHALALSCLVLVSACGGGGGSSPAPSPAPSPPANRAPTLTTTALSTNEDTSASAQLAATDPEGNTLTFSLTTQPQHGTATLSATGALSYAPAANYSGADSLGVTVNDGAGGQVAGTINITVTPVNDAPSVATLTLAVDEDGVLNAQLIASDVDGDAFSFEFVTGVSHGTLVTTPAGAINYTPATNFSGSDQFRVRAVESGSALASAEQAVNIEVRPVNDAPTAQGDTLRVAVTPGQPIVLPLLTNDADIEGDALTPIIIAQPRGGTVTVNAGNREAVFEPANGYVGPIEFTYRVNDGRASSDIADVRAVIGDVEPLIFLSDYTTTGVAELHVFDGLQVRRASDDLAPGSNVSNYSVSGDLRTLAYVVDSSEAERVYVKPLDGSAAAVLRYTSPPKTVPTERRIYVVLNVDGSYMTVDDRWTGASKHMFVVNTSTGAAMQVAGLMPGILDVRFAFFHAYEPTLLMVQAQTGGTPPHSYSDAAVTVFLGAVADPRTLTQIGRTYAPTQYGSGEGFYYGTQSRYLVYGEYLRSGFTVTNNLLVYDRTTATEIPLVRAAFPPDRGTNGFGWFSPDSSRMCISYYEPTTTIIDGPARFYSVSMTGAPTALPVSPVVADTTQCAYASDNRTMIYRVYTPGRVSQHAYAVDSVTPGTPRLLAPANEVNSEQGNWYVASSAMRAAVLYYDYDGSPSNMGQPGRFYSLPLDGTGEPFLFSDTYVYDGLSPFFASNADGSFIAYVRPQGSVGALELMSTHLLNYSIPLSRAGQTTRMRDARWLRRFP